MQLFKYILKRLVWMVITLFIIVVLTFFMMQVMPGTPFHNPKLTPDQLAGIMHAYGLDKPLWQQFLLYLGNTFTGNFGYSFTNQNQPVSMMIAQRLPVSAELGLEALVIGAIFGVLIGKLSAQKKNTWIDGLLSFTSTLFISIPSFVVAGILLIYFGYTLNWLPITGWDSFTNTILPAISLALGPTASFARFIRAEMVESLTSDYILLARAKGLSDREVTNRHALRNSLISSITLVGPMAAGLLTGSILIETIFDIPGIGSQFVSSIANKDFPVIMATTIVYAVMLMVFILITDIITALVDPRVRLQ